MSDYPQGLEPAVGQTVPLSNLRRDIRPEPKPVGGKGDVMREVILDIEGRITHGEEKYGQRVRAFNGRDAMRDLYQELMDALVYTKQNLMEGHDHDEQLQHLISEWGYMGVFLKLLESLDPAQRNGWLQAAYARAAEVIPRIGG